VPATLPHLLRHDCLHAPPPLGFPLAKPTTRDSPARNRPSPTYATSSMHSRRSQAFAHSAADADAHKVYHLGPATSTASSFRDSVPATLPHHLRSNCLHIPPPLGSPLAIPTTRYSPARNRLSIPHATSSIHCIRSQAPAHTPAAANARSVPLRSSDVSCVILPRLGASDAAPSAPTPLPARITTPRLAPRNPHHPLLSCAQPPQPTTRNIIHSQSAFASTRSKRSCRKCTQHTVEVQRRQLRHQ
jgi:hypothetical protein